MGNKATARVARTGNRSKVLRLAVGTALSAALTFGMLSAADAKTRTTMDGATQYGCAGTCQTRYYYCIQKGTSATICGQEYNTCLGNCSY